MKRTVTLLISVLLVLSALGCAANKHADIRKNLQEAKDAILIAKALDAPSGESTMLAEAERYYKIAEENFSRTPRGRLSGFLLQSKTLNAKASQNALLAKKKARAAVKEQQDKNKRLRAKIQSLQNDIQGLKPSADTATRKESAKTDQDEETHSMKIEPQAQTTYAVTQSQEARPEGIKEVKEIQLKLLSRKEERVMFLLSGAFRPKTFFLKGRRPRFVCDFLGARPGKKIPLRMNVDGKLVKRIRTWHHKGPNSKLRVVFDLTYPFKHKTELVMIENKNTYVVKLKLL